MSVQNGFLVVKFVAQPKTPRFVAEKPGAFFWDHKNQGTNRGVHNFGPFDVETTGPTIPRDPSALFRKIFLGKPPRKDENKLLNSTLPRTNIAPENMVFQKETSIPSLHFQEGNCLV